MEKKYLFVKNEYNGLDYTFDIKQNTFNDFLNFIDEFELNMKTSKYLVNSKRKLFKTMLNKLNVINKCKNDTEKYYNIIKNSVENNETNNNILTRQSTARLIIYIICTFCNVKYKTIFEKQFQEISCKDYGGTGYDEYCTGCENIFQKWNMNARKEIGLDYSDRFMTFSVPFTYKIGVTININNN